MLYSNYIFMTFAPSSCHKVYCLSSTLSVSYVSCSYVHTHQRYYFAVFMNSWSCGSHLCCVIWWTVGFTASNAWK